MHAVAKHLMLEHTPTGAKTSQDNKMQEEHSTCGRAEKAFKVAFMASPSHSPGRGMLHTTDIA